MTLYKDVAKRVVDPRVSALIIEEELEPSKGRMAVICPPTYSGDGPKGVPHYARSDDALIPARSESGWFHDNAVIDGRPRKGTRVVLNSLGACADASETALYRNQGRLGIDLPAIVVDATTVDETRIDQAIAKSKKSAKSNGDVTPGLRRQIQQSCQFRVSSWELAHRTADSWIMFAQESDSGRQLWATDGELKEILLNISHESGDQVFGYGPNSAVYGSWLSAGTARRHAIPRAYSCEIAGFGATEASRGATKLDRTGGATVKGRKLWESDGELVLGDKGAEPSKSGFGQVPTDPAARGFQCELILRQAAVSLKALDRFSYLDDPDRAKALAAKAVYTLLGIVGHLLAQEDGFLRSECDLVTVEERWGWREHGKREPQPMETPTLDEAVAALKTAIAAANKVGLKFQAPIELTLSDVQIGLIADRVINEGSGLVKAAE